MLENGLFLALGFLGATLIALMIAPAIWRRAVKLTSKRIEENVPLTLNEIRAEKDHLRADFAMGSRRLEVNNEKLKETAAERLIEINRKKAELLVLKDSFDEQKMQIADLGLRNKELQLQVEQREEELDTASAKLAATEISLEEKTASLEDIEYRYGSAVDEFDGQKIEMVARETRINTIKDQFDEIKKSKKNEEAENSRLTSELKAANTSLDKQKKRLEKLEKKYTKLQSDYADVEDRLERRETDLTRLRNNTNNNSASSAPDNFDLEDEVAELKSEKRKLLEDLQRAEADREAHKIELSTLSLTGGIEVHNQSDENALMRERISELAALVTNATANDEGEDSPIYDALDKEPDINENSSPKKPNKKNDQTESAEAPMSLAQRIRALQSSSEDA